MVFSLYIRKYCPFFSYISCHSISYRWFSIYISILEIWYFPIYIDNKHFFLLIFCPDSKFLYKDILFLLVPPQNLCVFSYIYEKHYFSLYFAQNYLYSYFPIYNKHSFSFLDLAQISS